MPQENLLHSDATIQWLLQGDPSIRWQVMRDLLDNKTNAVKNERELIAKTGWGAKLLGFQEPSGLWGGGLYSPKWISTTYTLLLLRRLGLSAQNEKAQKGCILLLNKGCYHDGGINFWPSYKYSETCVTGMILSILCHFRLSDTRIHNLVQHLLKQQMKDGGWNCRSYTGATHSSLHTTICVLEGLHEYEKHRPEKSLHIDKAQTRGREFLLVHNLFRSHRTGDIIKSSFTRFSFPPRWYYDILRALDYFQAVNAERDSRLAEAISIVRKKRKNNGRWLLQNTHPGKTYFVLEKAGEESRWNTLRALRILRWWENS